MAKVELQSDDRIRLSREATLDDIYRTTDELRLPVEPLSRSMPIVDFLVEGGFGYGSLSEGSLASKILKLTWTKSGRTYEYGLPNSTLYNAGYPLQRIVEMGRSCVLDMEFGRIESLTLLTSEATSPNIFFKKLEFQQMEIPVDATDAVFLNENAASLMKLDGAGMLVASQTRTSLGEAAEEAWGRRFLEDHLPSGLLSTRVVTVRSDLAELLDAAGPDSYCLVLATLKGFVANIYCSRQAQENLTERVQSLMRCYPLKQIQD